MGAIIVQMSVLLLLPAAVVAGVSIVSWHSLQSPRLFVLAALVLIYVLYAVIAYFTFPEFGGYFMEVPRNAPETNPSTSRTVFLADYAWQLALFSALCVPVSWVLLRLFRQ